jgi:GNAT superfamily N-acetyltransferase
MPTKRKRSETDTDRGAAVPSRRGAFGALPPVAATVSRSPSSLRWRVRQRLSANRVHEIHGPIAAQPKGRPRPARIPALGAAGVARVWLEGFSLLCRHRAGSSDHGYSAHRERAVCLRRVDLEDGLAEIGYWVVPAARGRGIAPRALVAVSNWAIDELGLHRLELQHSTKTRHPVGSPKRPAIP